MKKLPEKSPLYALDFSEKDRHVIQSHNRVVIQSAMESYDGDEQKVRISLNDLNINGNFVEDAYLETSFERRVKFSADIVYHSKSICNRRFQMRIEEVEDDNHRVIPIRLIDSSRLETTEGYEGNGFGMAMLIASEGIIPKLMQTLRDPLRTISHRVDGAKGAEQVGTDLMGYRFGWTSNILRSLGYSNNQETLKQCLGKTHYEKFRIPEAHWVKLFRE